MSDEDAVSESFFDVSGLPSEETDDDDPLVGTVLDGRYRLDRLLGEGGMGRVYAGTQLSVGREVAIKLLRGEALAQREVKERFLREAQVISGFSHPNIVRLIDYGEDTERGFPYLVMELVRGVSLGELTRRGRLDLPLALEIAYQVCGALVQAHSAGIIHRDLKPDNLQLMPVVGDSFQAKVLDFGIAFPRESDSRITSTGMICGTAYYIAPEQARAMELDGRADLYALGVILYQMLSGHLPFRGDSDFQILLMQVQESPPALSDYLPEDEVPGDVIKLVHDLLAKAPDDRPPSARAVRERIEVIRKRCAISALHLDLENASAEAFDRWILAPAKTAPIFEASTALDGSTPPELRDKLEERRQTLLEKDGVEEDGVEEDGVEEDGVEEDGVEEDGVTTDKTEFAEESKPPPGDTSASSQHVSSKTRVVAAVVIAVLAAGGAAIYLWQSHDEPGEDTTSARGDGAAAIAAADGPESEPVDGTKPAPTAALSAFAGRCMVIGESDTWFHTVFLYPEVGEVLLHGDQRLLWSPLEILKHAGKSLEFNYQTSDGQNSDGQNSDGQNSDSKKSTPTTVRVSADKLIFRLEGDTSTSKKSKFVCRKHDVQKYYDTLGISGTFAQIGDSSGDSQDDSPGEQADAGAIKRQVEIPSSGQRVNLPNGEYVYRILGGVDLSEGHKVALRRAADTEASWELATIAFDENTGVLSIERGGQEHEYRSKEAAREAARAAKEAAEEEEARREKAARARAARRKSDRRSRPEPPSKPTPASTASAGSGSSNSTSTSSTPSGSTPTGSEGPDQLPPHLQPAPKRVFEKYEKKVRDVVARYCTVLDERSSQVEHYQKLIADKRIEEAKTYRDEVLNDTASYSMKIQSVSYSYSDAVQRAAQSGLNTAQIQKLTRIWQKGCD